MIGVYERCDSSWRISRYYYTISVINIELLTHVSKLLKGVVISSEIEAYILVLYWIFSAASELTSIAVYYEDFGPIMKIGVRFGQGW